MPIPTHAVLSSALSSHVPLAAVPGGGLVGTKGVLNSLMGWEDVEANIHEHDLLDQEVVHSIIAAEQQFHRDPTPQNRARFKTALRQAQQASEQLRQYCLKQQAYYQTLLDQELAAQNQPQSYFASWQNWAWNGVKYFFGSDNAALVEKYRQASLKQQELQTNLQAVLDELSLDTSQRRLLSNNTVTVKEQIPTQIVEPGDAYDYTINGTEIFEGNFSFLDITTADGNPFPQWLNKGPGLCGSYNTGSAQGIAVQGSLAFVVDAGGSLQVIDISNPVIPALRGNYDTPGDANSVALQGSLAFVADYGAGLQIIDVSNASNPVLRGRYDTPGTALGVALQGLLAFVADASSGLQIVDVSNASNPVFRGSYDTPGSACDVALQGSLVFVADYYSLQIIDVSNPAIPVLRGSYNTPGRAQGVVVQGLLAFVADYDFGLQIIDVSNPAIPVLRGNYNTPGIALAVVLQGSLAFVADRDSGLQIIDVSDASNPVLRGSYNTPGTAYGVAVQGSLVFVADGDFGLHILDQRLLRLSGTPLLSDLGRQTLSVIAQNQNNFTQLASTDFDLVVTQLPQRQDNTLSTQSILPGETLFLLLDADQLFNDRGGNFLRLSVDLVSTSQMPSWMNLTLSPVLRGNYNTPGFALSVAVQGSLAFVADGNFGLQFLDVSNPAIPVLRGNYDTPGFALGVAVQGLLAFVANDNFGVQIIDVNNTVTPVLRGNYNTLGSAESVAVKGLLAFVAEGSTGLQIIDVSNPTIPVLRGNYTTPGTALDVALQSLLAFVADGASGLQIVDVSNASNPLLRGSYDTPGIAYGVALQGSLAFVADGDFGLQIIDVSNVSNPVFRGSCDTPGSAWNIALQGSLVFVADYYSLQIIDVSNPAIPVLRGSYDTPGQARDVALQGSLAFVADYDAGLQILGISQWTFKATPSALDVGNYELRVTVTNELGGSASDTFLLRVEGPPQFNSTIGQLYAKVGRVFNYFIPQGLISDPNLDPITFSAHNTNQTTLLPWLSFNAVSGIFTGTALSSDVGNYSMTLGAQDNNPKTSYLVTEQNFFLYVDYEPVPNKPIAPQVAGIDVPFQFVVDPLTFTDPDGDTLSYDMRERSQTSLPSWLQFNASSRTLSGLANITHAGQWNLIVGANDPYGGRAEDDLSILVEYTPYINLPILNQAAGVNLPFSLVVDPNTFADRGGDLLTYRAQQQNGGVLPNFLSFSTQRLTFTGTPLVSDLGDYPLQLVATDPYGGSVAAQFLLRVIYFPEVVGAIPAAPLLCVGRNFNFTVPGSIFRDLGGATLQYNASLANGVALPTWLQFNGQTLTFTGIPTEKDEGALDVVVVAADAQGGTVQAPITLSITPNYPPVLQTPVSNQVAEVGNAFSLFVDPATFTDANGDVLTYRATQAGGASLPSWLNFNALRIGFSGTPGRGDTDFYADSVIAVDLSASDGVNAPVHTVFNINVRGVSWGELAIKIIAPIISALSTVYALHKNRALFLNRYKPDRYQRVMDNPKPGEYFERQLETPVSAIYDFATQVPRKIPLACCRHAFFPYRLLADGAKLPRWLMHDRVNNRLCSDGVVPEELAGKTLIIQVLGKGNVIVEEFKLVIEKMDRVEEMDETLGEEVEMHAMRQFTQQ